MYVLGVLGGSELGHDHAAADASRVIAPQRQKLLVQRAAALLLWVRLGHVSDIAQYNAMQCNVVCLCGILLRAVGWLSGQ